MPYETKAQFQQSLWDRLGGSSKEALMFMLQKKLQEKQRQQQIEDFRKKLQIQKEMGVLNPPTTQITIQDVPFDEKMEARQILAATPEQLATDPDMASFVQQQPMNLNKWNFWGDLKYGLGRILGRRDWRPQEMAFTPGFEGVKEEAAQLLAKPQRTTQRISYKGAQEDVESTLPDPTTTEEGSEYETDDGTVYKLVNGEWVIQNG